MPRRQRRRRHEIDDRHAILAQRNALVRRDRIAAADNSSAALNSAFEHRVKLDVPLLQRPAVERHVARDGLSAERVVAAAAGSKNQQDDIRTAATGAKSR